MEIPEENSSHTYLAVIRMDPALKKDETYFPKAFLKQSKYIEKKVVRHIHDNLSDFSSDDDESDEYDKELNNIFRKGNIQNVFFEGAILKMYFF